MIGLLVAALITVGATDRPLADRTVGPWVVRQEEAGSPLRSLFTSVEQPGSHLALMLECDGTFFVDVMATKGFVYADDDEATLIFDGGVERKAPALMTGHKLLHISATSLMEDIIGAARMGVRLRRKDGTTRDEFFALPDLSAGKPLLRQFCPAPVKPF